MNYCIITSAGYWGQGKTLNEATKNANVRAGKPVRGLVLQAEERFHEKMTVDDMGGVSWTLTDQMVDLPREVQGGIKSLSNLGYFNLKMVKGDLSMTVLPE